MPSDPGGPILSDGTPLRGLLDRDRREVALRVLHDPEIFELELERLFARSWVIVAHETEIPEPGDYVRRTIGADPVIVTRARDGAVHVLLNVCTHRGMQVCWADRGHDAAFRCRYHGWSYSADGSLVGAPFERDLYGGELPKHELGLRRANVELRHGVVFATFADDPPTLDEYLGDMAWYVDFAAGGIPEWEVLHGGMLSSSRHYAANWKPFIEQLAGDSYHAFTTHRAPVDIGLFPTSYYQKGSPDFFGDHAKVSFPGTGHNVVLLGLWEAWKRNPNIVSSYQVVSEDREVRQTNDLLCEIFPGNLWMSRPCQLPDGRKVLEALIGSVVPIAPDEFSFQVFTMVPKGLSEEDRAAIRAMDLLFISLFGVEDNEVFLSIQRASRGVVGRKQTLKYATLAGPSQVEGWPGPGTLHAGDWAGLKDDNQWRFWERWFDVMCDQGRTPRG
jgi:phenylpropionate dioxygenase-like ring-hydroxylating dioxygenase large terminal subunit